ncbi:MAG: hypothetical protein BKP49_09075 [Treponema sp. CETP13]|nr:MAG: hypothetical protein BKP49_09075 [Treponema sp. CETP13]
MYVLLSVCFGKQGIWAYHQLQEYKIAVTENVSNLQELNESIRIDKKSLESDKDIIIAFAHSMGFVSDNENLVKITGITPYSKKVYDAGNRIQKPKIVYMPDWMAKFAGFFVFLIINLISSLFMLLHISTNSSKNMVLNTAVITSGDFNDFKQK